MTRNYEYAFHVALDGSGLNGLDGRAGVCVFLFDPTTGDHAYKVKYYDAVAGGHAPALDPSRRIGSSATWVSICCSTTRRPARRQTASPRCGSRSRTPRSSRAPT